MFFFAFRVVLMGLVRVHLDCCESIDNLLDDEESLQYLHVCTYAIVSITITRESGSCFRAS